MLVHFTSSLPRKIVDSWFAYMLFAYAFTAALRHGAHLATAYFNTKNFSRALGQTIWSQKCKVNGTKLHGRCSGIATGGSGGRVPPLDSEKFAKNREKEQKVRKKQEKEENWGREGMENSGRFCHFPPSDRQGWLRYWADDNYH